MGVAGGGLCFAGLSSDLLCFLDPSRYFLVRTDSFRIMFCGAVPGGTSLHPPRETSNSRCAF